MKKTAALTRPLSALEYTVLGVLWKRQPCSGYTILREFSTSRTTYFRSGAGSIYPVLKRLTTAGLISAEPPEGRDKTYRVTAAGLQELQHWISGNLGPEDISTSLDLLRTRVYFLATVAPAQAREFLTAAKQGLELLVEDSLAAQQHYVTTGDQFSEMAARGAVLETEARLQWVKELLARYPVD